MRDLSITQYVENFERAFPQRPVKVHANRHGFQVFIDGHKVGDPMSRAELEAASRTFRAGAPRAYPRATGKLGDIAHFKA